MNRHTRTPELHPQRRVLDNGAVMLWRPTPDAYGVAVGVAVKVGTRDENGWLGGMSHLVEHMVFKGTGQRTAFELARDMEAIGASLDAYTTKEHTGYTVKVLPEHLPQALSILSDMLLDSTFPEDQLELEKQVVVEEILSSEDNPDDHVHELFTEKLLGAHPLSRPILGTQQSVEAAGVDDLRGFVRQNYHGGNVVLAATGRVGEAEAAMVADAFPFRAGEAPAVTVQDASPAPGVHCVVKDLSQQYVEMGIPAVGANHPDRYAVTLLASILGGGMSSRLFQKVREERGLAYSVYSYADTFRDVGSLCTSFSASAANAQAALEVVEHEYRALRAGDLPLDEIEMNKAQLVGAVVLGLEGSMNQMSRLARNEMSYGRFVPLEEIVDAFEAVTRDDLVRVADTYLDPALQTVVAYGPAERLGR